MTKLIICSGIALLLFVLITTPLAQAEEYSAITGNTVWGRSYGVPHYGEVGKLSLVTEMAFIFKTLEIFNLQHVLGET